MIEYCPLKYRQNLKEKSDQKEKQTFLIKKLKPIS